MSTLTIIAIAIVALGTVDIIATTRTYNLSLKQMTLNNGFTILWTVAIALSALFLIINLFI